MKKILVLFAAMSLLVATNASAAFIDTYLNLNAVDATYFLNDGGDGITESFSEFTYYAETISQISSAGVIVDSGLAHSDGLNTVSNNVPGDTEDEGSNWGFTFVWDNLTGQVTSNVGGVIEAVYTSGTFDFFVDYNPYALNFDDPGTLTDGTLVATVKITSGGYRLDTTSGAGSSYTLYGDFKYILDNFWYDAATGEDLADDLLEKGWVFAYTAGDNDPESVNIVFNDDKSLTVTSSHDSSMSIGVVPEPSTFLLLGAGLVGLGFVSRRKNRN